MLQEHHIAVTRTARFYTLGDPGDTLEEIWFVCHGYAQLAARFLPQFAPLDNGHRLFVAPEGLSRFYIEKAGGDGSHAQMPVGASWMTRDDRLSEIEDHVRFLDALYAQTLQNRDRDKLVIVVLGFSQGVATVSRWIARGRSRADQLILWGGLVPPDLDLQAHGDVFRSLNLTMVAGDQDGFVKASDLAANNDRLIAAGITPRTVTYSGGHRIDPATLAHLV